MSYICDTCFYGDRNDCSGEVFLVCDECGHEACCSDGFTPMWTKDQNTTEAWEDFCCEECCDRARERGYLDLEEMEKLLH
jgi:hypothetical protein